MISDEPRLLQEAGQLSSAFAARRAVTTLFIFEIAHLRCSTLGVKGVLVGVIAAEFRSSDDLKIQRVISGSSSSEGRKEKRVNVRCARAGGTRQTASIEARTEGLRELVT